MRLPLGAKIGLVVGLIGAVIGIVVAIMADPIFGSIMAVIIIAVFGGTFGTIFGRMASQNRLLKTGVSATAVIKELKDTGVTVNNAPQIKLLLEVTPPTGAPYLVQTKTLISRLETSSFQPGMVLPVKIDPNNKNKIAIDRTGGASYSDGASYSAGDSRSNASGMTQQEAQAMLEKVNDENNRIMAYGQSAKAIVTNYKWLGVYVNGQNPFVSLDLEVLPDSDKPFKASAKGVIKDTSVPKYQPGKEIWVKYDSEDHSKVTVDHS
jgi:hypothetical protein